jgi:hypothetical protein
MIPTAVYNKCLGSFHSGCGISSQQKSVVEAIKCHLGNDVLITFWSSSLSLSLPLLSKIHSMFHFSLSFFATEHATSLQKMISVAGP